MSKRPLSDGSTSKPKRLCSFCQEFTGLWPFIVKTQRSDYARCTICNVEFSIGHQGKNDCQRHIQSQKHSKLAAASKGNSSMKAFMSLGHHSLEDDVTRAEVLFTRFLIEHNIPLSAADHAKKLFQAMFLGGEHNASEIIRKYSCARTKTTCIIKKIAEMESCGLSQAMASGPYCLATDTSNDRNEKLFPIVVRLENKGVVETHLLSILELIGKGTGENISNLILEDLRRKNIPIGNCMALTTDNANVMVGATSGLYGHFLKENKDMFATGCVCHRIHLAAVWANKELPKSVGNFFLDIYYYMDKSANRVHSFQEYQEACGTPVTAVCKHCPTRWLSMAETCAWVLQQWEPLRQFFKSENENEKSDSQGEARGC